MNKGGNAFRINKYARQRLRKMVRIDNFCKQQSGTWREKRLCGNISHLKLATVRSRYEANNQLGSQSKRSR